MAEGTYDFEVMRAELLGVAPPNKKEFEKARAERLEIEKAEAEAAEANLLEQQEESMKNSGGKLDELNSILSSTQSKINRFKNSARGSLSNIFSRGSMDSDSRRESVASGSAAEPVETLPNLDDINNTTRNANEASQEISKKMTSHLDKLDSLISKAERAEMSMQSQNSDMRRMINK